MSQKPPCPNLTILLPGGSLSRWARRDIPQGGGPVVCVNRAILAGQKLARVDRLVWAWLDCGLYLDMLARPGLDSLPVLTLQSRCEQLWLTDRLKVRTIWTDPASENRDGILTFPYTLRWALQTNAPEIHVFGCDHTQAPDWDGQQPIGANRSPERWANERDQLRPLLSPRVVFHR